MKRLVKLQNGLPVELTPNKPIICLVGSGRSAYLWVGNDAKDSRHCFGHVAGTERLRSFATSLLKALPRKKRKAK